MTWKDEGGFYSFDKYPRLRCYKRVGGREFTPEEYIQVLHGKSPLFDFESSRKPGTTFQAYLKLSADKRQLTYQFPDEKTATPPSRSPAEFRADQPKTPTHQEELAWLREALHLPSLHALPFVLVPYRFVAPNNPMLKEEAKLCPVGILELATVEDMTTEVVKNLSKQLAPRVKAILAIAERLRVKAYVICMSPTCSHFWVCCLTDKTPWEKKTTQTMPGFLSLLRRMS